MALQSLNLKGVYCSEQDSLLHDFYIPTLAQSTRYDRAAGYFSAATLSFAAQGLSSFVNHEGRVRLLIGDPLDPEEYEAVKRGINLKETHERINSKVRLVLENAEHALFKNRLELLSWLVAAGRLEIRIALTVRGLYHDKVGIFSDSEKNQIVFQGSANETAAALLPHFNYETIAVFPSWKAALFQAYGQPHIERFERLWEGRSPNVTTIDLPSESYERLTTYYNQSSPPSDHESSVSPQSVQNAVHRNSHPTLPAELGGNPYELLTHQRGALSEWKARDYQGILALATGAGKTITALHAAVKVSEAHLQRGRNFVLIVSVPYQVLADQWCESMEAFNIHPIRCYRSRTLWYSDLDDAVSSLKLSKEPRFLCAVVVNATMSRSDFQSMVQRITKNDMMFVGDECHHHGSPSLTKHLPDARYRLGLSATPWSENEMERKDLLKDYYGGITATYSLGRALQDHVLTPYTYYCYPIALSEDESDDYQSLSDDIGRLVAIKEQGGSVNEDELTSLYMRRARLLGSADAKFQRLTALAERSTLGQHTLFYCGDGSTECDDGDRPIRDVERCAEILGQAGWKTSRFTAAESHSERNCIMHNFRFGYIDGIVAIRVLDEGFDMPVCREAFLLASSRNDRQFVQRRGRILRRAPGKTSAVIHDFIVLPHDSFRSSAFTNLVKQELMRCIEFTRFAQNSSDAWQTVEMTASEHGLNVESLLMEVQTREVVSE